MALESRLSEHDRGPASVGSVVLLDEHPLWLDALENVLASAGVVVVGRTCSPAVAVDLVAQERPDALVASLDLPSSDMDAVHCLRQARERRPGLRIVALSTHHDAFRLASAAAAGAHAYLPKTAEPSELAATVVECLANGEKRGPAARRRKPLPNGRRLTARELEILHLVARGYTNEQVAQRLWITKWTVKFHLANAYRKLGVSNRTQAARYVFDLGLSELSHDRPV